MFIDSHAHISKDYYDDVDLVIRDAYHNNVKIIVISCCEIKEIEYGIELIKKYNNLFLCIGLHPSEADNYTDSDLDYIADLVKKNDKIVAVGEIGLDYYYGKDNKNKQIDLFEKQLKIAEKLNKPVVIHTRDASNDTIKTLKKYNVSGVIHCFNGSAEVLKEYIKLGFKIGIGGVLTFKNTKLGDIIKTVSLDNIVLETDSPYLTPEPFRGKKNEPKNIPVIAKKVSEIYNVGIDDVEKITSQNIIRLFDLDRIL